MSDDTQQTPTLADLPLTDAGNAERLILLHGERVRYVAAWRAWRTFDGRRWVAGPELVMRLTRETMRTTYAAAVAMLEEAKNLPDPEERKPVVDRATRLAKWATTSEATPNLKRAIEQAASFKEIEADPLLFQPRPWVVPFQNCVWDRGEIRKHRASDHFEVLLPVCYEPDADRADLDTLLDRLTGGDADLARTLQDVAGYALSGASSLRCLFWLYGPAGTGKSTFAELLRAALGEAAATLDKALARDDAKDEAIGRAIRGKRAVFLPEMGGKRVSAETAKGLTGSDPWVYRALYGNDSYSIPPTWAVLAVSNDPPTMAAHDEALRERLLALPFVHRLDEEGRFAFTEGARIEEYRRRTDTALMAGFVAYAVEGLARVHQAGDVHRAAAAIAHTRTFWEDTDPLTPFWEQEDLRQQLGTEEGMGATVLHEAYLAWCERERVARPMGKGKAFAKACEAAGLVKQERAAGTFWSRPQGADGGINGRMAEKPHFATSSKNLTRIRGFTENTPDSAIPPSGGVWSGVL